MSISHMYLSIFDRHELPRKQIDINKQNDIYIIYFYIYWFKSTQYIQVILSYCTPLIIKYVYAATILHKHW